MISNRKEVDAIIDELLTSIKFPNGKEVRYGLLDIVNMISDYHEEGVALFPEVIVVDSADYFKTFRCHCVKIALMPLEQHVFSHSIKMCAPLAVNGWSIYLLIDHKNNSIEYGILTTELQVLSLSLYEQAIEAGIPEINCIYLRNVGNKVVEVRDVQTQFLIALSLNENYVSMDDTIKSLVEVIFSQEGNQRESRNFLEKTIHQALNEGHGNLIAVVHDDKMLIDETLKKLRGGILLDKSIDLQMLAAEYKSQLTEESSLKLRSHADLVRSILNFDGITLFTDQGRILGYHFIVNNNEVKAENIQGGSRTRAYLALCGMESIRACFIKSQDGKVNFHVK